MSERQRYAPRKVRPTAPTAIDAERLSTSRLALQSAADKLQHRISELEDAIAKEQFLLDVITYTLDTLDGEHAT